MPVKLFSIRHTVSGVACSSNFAAESWDAAERIARQMEGVVDGEITYTACSNCGHKDIDERHDGEWAETIE